VSDVADFIIQQGCDWTQQFNFQNDDGSVLVLTGCQVHMEVRAFAGSPVVLLSLSTATDTITLDGPAGQINWDIPAAQTADFQPSAGLPLGSLFQPGTVFFGYYDLLIEFPNGQIIPYLSGRILLKLGITIPF
jgi:hypothetical protein